MPGNDQGVVGFTGLNTPCMTAADFVIDAVPLAFALLAFFERADPPGPWALW